MTEVPEDEETIESLRDERQDLLEIVTPLSDEVTNLRNALKWLHHQASIHAWGGAFEPAHMAFIANAASAALRHEEFPDYDRSMAKAHEAAADRFVKMGFVQDEDNTWREPPTPEGHPPS